jgi:hypothetical protein
MRSGGGGRDRCVLTKMVELGVGVSFGGPDKREVGCRVLCCRLHTPDQAQVSDSCSDSGASTTSPSCAWGQKEIAEYTNPSGSGPEPAQNLRFPKENDSADPPPGVWAENNINNRLKHMQPSSSMAVANSRSHAIIVLLAPFSAATAGETICHRRRYS